MSSDALRRIVFGFIKHARQHARRQTTSRFGLMAAGRKVATELPANLPDRGSHSDRERENNLRQWRRLIVMLQLQDFTTVPEYRELLQRRLFDGERIATIAADLKISAPTARSVVMRALRYLGLRQPHGSNSQPSND